MGSENFNRQFILLRFRRSGQSGFPRVHAVAGVLDVSPHAPPHLAYRANRTTWVSTSTSRRDTSPAHWIARRWPSGCALSLVSVSNDITSLARRKVIESLRTGRQNIFVLGRWVEDEGAYFEHFYLDRLYVRSKENLISGLLEGRNKENFTSDDNLSRRLM